MTSPTRDQGTERRAETAVFGWMFLPRMHHYRFLAKENRWSSGLGSCSLESSRAYFKVAFQDSS